VYECCRGRGAGLGIKYPQLSTLNDVSHAAVCNGRDSGNVAARSVHNCSLCVDVEYRQATLGYPTTCRADKQLVIRSEFHPIVEAGADGNRSGSTQRCGINALEGASTGSAPGDKECPVQKRSISCACEGSAQSRRIAAHIQLRYASAHTLTFGPAVQDVGGGIIVAENS